MRFIDYSKEVYSSLQNKDFSNFDYSSKKDFLSVMFSLKKEFSLEKYKQYYRKEIERIINVELPLEDHDSDFSTTLKEYYYYDETTPKYSTLFLFWIWHNNIALKYEDVESIIKAIIMGTIGYRFIDMYGDGERKSKDIMFLGNYLIRSFENMFIHALGFENSYSIMHKYGLRFAHVEFIEKRNLWKKCPFTWEKPEILSYKSAPLLAIFESVFKYSNYDKKKIEDLISAFVNVLVVNQMLDDLSDAKDDLSTGRETLVMSGFYKEYGIDINLSSDLIEAFLTQERMFKIYKVMRLQLDNAMEMFKKHNDEIFLLFTEFFRQKFHNQFEIRNPV